MPSKTKYSTPSSRHGQNIDQLAKCEMAHGHPLANYKFQHLEDCNIHRITNQFCFHSKEHRYAMQAGNILTTSSLKLLFSDCKYYNCLGEEQEK